MLDVAYAVVPHIVSRIGELDPERQIEVLDDIAVVEKVRVMSREQVTTLIESVAASLAEEIRDAIMPSLWDRKAPLPSDLSPVYLAAMDTLAARFGPAWRERAEEPRPWRRHVRYLREAGWRNEDIAFAVEILRADDPPGTCWIYTLSREDARRSLCDLPDAPAGWLERTRLDQSDGELGFRAAYGLAWWSSITVEAIVRSET